MTIDPIRNTDMPAGKVRIASPFKVTVEQAARTMQTTGAREGTIYHRE